MITLDDVDILRALIVTEMLLQVGHGAELTLGTAKLAHLLRH